MNSLLKTIILKLSKFLHWLINPKIPYDDLAVAHKSRLLALGIWILLLVFSGVDTFFTLTIPNYQVPWFGYGLMFSAYLLNRYKYYAWAAGLTILMFPMVIFSSIYGGTAANIMTTLNYTVLGLILCSIFLRKSGVTVLGIINTIGIMLMPSFSEASEITYSMLVGPLSTNLIATSLIVI